MNNSPSGLIPTAKIAVDASLAFGQSTGDSTYWTCLLKELIKKPSPFEFLLFSPNPPPTELSLPRHVQWRQLSAKSSRWWQLVQFPLAARREGASVLHSQYNLSPLSPSRSISTIHDVSFYIGPEWFPARHRLILQRGIPLTVRRAKKVITVSETSRSEIERYVPAARGKTSVTYNACPDWIRPVPRDVARQQVKEMLGVTAPYLLTVGTRWPRKNMGLAVQSVNNLAQDLPHLLLITGKAGWGESELGQRGKATGYVDTALLSALYSAAELYLAPSLHEGFGIPVLEAWRCGCPVLAGRGGAFPEVVQNPQALVDDYDARTWTSRIESLLQHPSNLRELAEIGAQRERQFTWSATADRNLDIYREVLETTP